MKKKILDIFYKKLQDDNGESAIAAITLPMAIISNMMHAGSKHIFEKYGLTHSEMDMLATLHMHNGGLTATEVSERLLFTSGGISKVVKKLESKRLIYKKVSKKDKRSFLLYNTETGNQIVESCIPQFEEHQKKFFEVLNDTEREIIENALKKVLYNFTEK